MLTHAFFQCSKVPTAGGRIMDVQTSGGDTNTHEVP